LCSEDAVECDDLATFLRLDEVYDPSVEDERPLLAEKTIGVPGVSPSPSPMPTPSKPKLSTQASVTATATTPMSSPAKPTLVPATPATPVGAKPPPPTPVVGRDGDAEEDDEFASFGLQGLKITDDELSKLVEQLGLEGKEADELVKGLGGRSEKEKK
jgi:SH3 domain-binding glutamic acid-rich protein